MGFTDTLIVKGDKLVRVSETNLLKLRKRLTKVESDLNKAHEKEFDGRVGTSRYWKMSRKIDMLAQEKFELINRIKELE